ncbi:flavin reductase family protein [Agrobacterium rubi]|nr:flavin reductase family protein [Agrobacterium rubi]MBP1878760.1 flavin reductase (DIM6/NTAB) family NADH-FMN oxidoreductase RutF [Agrobacterium rubi]MCL6652879.1 flavin reductase [Agrobacterium rubi]OCJ51464.1 flavin reductase [Agrobacterium rubi]GAK69723.1 putative oxidoreductase [Agrobacterium rubi TR3 = NBRC 13261]
MTATVTYLQNEAERAVFDSNALKAAMRSLAGGVSVITAGTGANRTGATVTSATALSMDPATMIVNINKSSSTWPIISRFNHFCVNILSAEQQEVAARFAGVGGLKGAERYAGADWFTLESGAYALKGALAAIDCAVEDVIERHTHAIIIGRVLSVEQSSGEPLVYHGGQYAALAQRALS